MNKILIAGCTLLTAFAAVAMPNKKELAKAQRLVADVTAADLKALKAGKLTAKEVAETHMQLAEKAENQAEKYLLYQGAFRIYARNEEYDRAADALQAISRDVDDVPPELIIEIVSKEMRRVAGKKAPRVLTIFKQAKRTAKYRKEIVTVEAGLKAKPHDTELNRKYGECLAELGRWKESIPAFAKAAGEVSKIAAGEKDGKLPPQQCADFWWDYGGETEDFTTYKAHAAQLYKKAIADAAFEGLARTRAEQRVKDIDKEIVASPALAEMMVARIPAATRKEPFVFDLGPGVRKLELIRCPAGTYTMGYRVRNDGKSDISTPHKVRISRPFWLAKFPLTISQMKALVPTFTGKDRRPDLPGKFPENVDAPLTYRYWNKEIFDTFFAELNRRFANDLPSGYVLRYPTAAEWEYALRDGGDGTYVQKDGMLAMSHRVKRNGVVCELKPNAWGFYDMLGMAGDFFLDSGDFVNLTFPQVEIDPIYGLEQGKHAMIQAGKMCLGDRRHDYNPLWNSFRLCIGPDLVAEKTARQSGVVNKTLSDLEGLYLEIDLSGGVNAKSYPARIVTGKVNTNVDQYKTNKLLLKYVKPGTFLSGDSVRAKDKCKEISIQSGFLLDVFEVTQRQWELVMGNRPSFFTNATDYAMRPVESVTRDEIGSFIKQLNSKMTKDCGVEISLPYAQQWEYACRAGTSSDWFNGKSYLSSVDERLFFEIGRCRDNGGWSVSEWGAFVGKWEGAWQGRNLWMSQYPVKMRNCGSNLGTAKVGAYHANAWGFYDMLGNVSEHCDKDGCRGGNVRTTAKECIPTDLNGSGLTHYNIGFRLAGQISSDKWNEKHKTRK